MPSTFAPLTSSAASRDALEAALAGLDLSWSVLGGLAFGAAPDEVSVDFIALHPQRGIALIDAAPGGGADTAARFQALLSAERFHERYPGRLPIVHLRVDADGAAEIESRLEAGFGRAPSLNIRDGSWVPALAELLTSEPSPMVEDVPVAPPMNEATVAQPRREIPIARPRDEATVAQPRPVARQSEPAAAAFARAADQVRRPPSQERPILRPPPRRTGTLAAAIALLLGAGAGVAAVQWSGQTDLLAYLQPSPDQDEISLSASNPATRAEPVAPAPPPAATPPNTTASTNTAPPPNTAVAPDAAPTPPPLPPREPPARQAAPPQPPKSIVTREPAPPASPPPSVAVVPLPAPEPPPPPVVKAPEPPKAATAAVELPPIPSPKPEFKAPEPDPRATAKAPEPVPSPVAKAPEAAPKAETPPPQAQAAIRPPEPAPSSRAEAPPPSPPAVSTRSKEATARSGGPIPLRPGSSIPRGGPPIDATDLPPLEGSGSRTYDAPRQEASRRWEAPNTTAGSGATAAAAAGNNGSPECRPYVADTTITGASRPVSGLACRQPDGRWKLVTERPAQ